MSFRHVRTIQCYVTGKGANEAVVGEKSTAFLQVDNFESKPCEKPITVLESGLLSEITGTRANCSASVADAGVWSQYEINYQPTIKGKHQLHIKAEGQHVRGSPLSIEVTDFGAAIGRVLGTIGVVKRPWGMAINRRGEVVITEVGGGCVSVFNLDGAAGSKLQSFGIYGSGRPYGVAVDGEGNILTADCWNSCVQKFTEGGQFLTAVRYGSLHFSKPRGIAFNASNNKVYVADTDNHCVQVLNSDLTFSKVFGSLRSGKGRFSSPHGIVCDNAGKVYVADTNNDRIQVFTAEGRSNLMFGRPGQGKGELESPIGVAVDSRGMVYVSERGSHRISVFNSEGQFVTSFGKKGKGPGEFESPCGLAVDNSGVVYVCDHYNNQVQMF